jgi:hypothetical protein
VGGWGQTGFLGDWLGWLEWIQFSQHRDRWRALVHTEMILLVLLPPIFLVRFIITHFGMETYILASDYNEHGSRAASIKLLS